MKIFRSQGVFAVACICIAITKLFLIANNEILALGDDSIGYVRQALRRWTLDFPPAYPVWLRLTMSTGWPQRLLIEILFLTGAFLLAVQIKAFLNSRLAAVLTFALLALTPASYFLFNHALSDGFYTCVSLFALGTSLYVFRAHEAGAICARSILLGALLGVMASTRNEDPLIGLWVLLLLFFSWLTWQDQSDRFLSWSNWKNPLIAGFATGTTVAAIVSSVGFSYMLADGVFARSISLVPGHQKLLSNLAAIETGETQKKWIPISRRARELAYSVSPTLAHLRAGVEDPNNMFQAASRREAGLPPGEVGGGWIWQIINGQVLSATGDYVKARAMYSEINAELERAFQDGRLKRRFVVQPLLGRDLWGVFGRVPESIKPVFVSSTSALPDYTADQDFESALFDEVLLRRDALIETPGPVSVVGWAFINSPGRRIAHVRLASADSSSTAEVHTIDRPDVSTAFLRANGWAPIVTGFSGQVETEHGAASIIYTLDDGTQLRGDHLVPMHVSTVQDASRPSTAVMQGIDIVTTRRGIVSQTRHAFQVWAVGEANAVGGWLFAFGIITLPLLVATRRVMRKRAFAVKPRLVLFGSVLVLWTARLLFYSILNAAAWQADQIRYLAPDHMLGLVLVALSASSLVHWIAIVNTERTHPRVQAAPTRVGLRHIG